MKHTNVFKQLLIIITADNVKNGLRKARALLIPRYNMFAIKKGTQALN
jgi:hypothetical protein